MHVLITFIRAVQEEVNKRGDQISQCDSKYIGYVTSTQEGCTPTTFCSWGGWNTDHKYNLMKFNPTAQEGRKTKALLHSWEQLFKECASQIGSMQGNTGTKNPHQMLFFTEQFHAMLKHLSK